jgi:opacity protein-like surface antigen
MSKNVNRAKSVLLFTASLFIYISSAYASDDWLVGKWKLHFDPDGAETDYMEFKADGDVISTGPNGRVEGLYQVNPGSVKAVFTYKEKDFIMTFHFNEQRDELRIVTSHTGRESIYKKVIH